MINKSTLAVLGLIFAALLISSCSIDPFELYIDVGEYIGEDKIMEIDEQVAEIDSTYSCPIAFSVGNYQIDYVKELNIDEVIFFYDFAGFSPNGSATVNIDIYFAEDSTSLYDNEPAVAFDFPIVVGDTTEVIERVSIDPSLLDLFAKRKFAMGFCNLVEEVEAEGDSIQGSIWARQAWLTIKGDTYIKP